MVRKVVTALVLVPLAIVCIAFAVANRQTISVALDPFDPVNPALTVRLPLFLLILIPVIAGVVLGGIAAWLRQGKWRRAARRAERETHRLRAELAQRKQRTDLPDPPTSARRMGHVSRLTIPPPAA